MLSAIGLWILQDLFSGINKKCCAHLIEFCEPKSRRKASTFASSSSFSGGMPAKYDVKMLSTRTRETSDWMKWILDVDARIS